MKYWSLKKDRYGSRALRKAVGSAWSPPPRFFLEDVGVDGFVGERSARVALEGDVDALRERGIEPCSVGARLEKRFHVLSWKGRSSARVCAEGCGPASEAYGAGEIKRARGGWGSRAFPVEQSCKRHRSVGHAAFEQAQGSHVDFGDASGAAMGHFGLVGRRGSGKDVLPSPVAAFVDGAAHGVPYLRDVLPLVDDMGPCSRERQACIYLHRSAHGVVVYVDDAFPCARLDHVFPQYFAPVTFTAPNSARRRAMSSSRILGL